MGTVDTFRSTDASAPSLNGNAGSLVSLLDGVLVNGYGSQAAAGWTIAYTGSNKRVYRNSAVDGTGMYLYVDDSGPGGAGAAEARMTGFQAASGLGTGTGQFPTLSQMNQGIGSAICRKSSSNNGTARAWTIVADNTVFYLFIESADFYSPIIPTFFMFGDIFSVAASDPYRCAIIGRCQENNNSANAEWFASHCGPGNGYGPVLNQLQGGHFLAANAQGVGGSLCFGKHIDNTKMGGSYCTGSTTVNPGTNPINNVLGNSSTGSPIGSNYNYPTHPMQLPNPTDGGIYMSPIWVHHNNSLRGYLKGLWAPLHHLPLNHNDTFNGSGNMSGKSFVVQSIQGWNNGNPVAGQLFIENSSTWS